MATFVEKDWDILSKKYYLKDLSFRGPSDSPSMAGKIMMSHLSFCWFASSPTDLAVRFSKLFGRKSAVIVGGFEVVSLEDIGYGAMRDPNSDRARKIRYAIENADLVLAVSESIKKDILRRTHASDVVTVYHGFDYNYFSPRGEKEPIALTVGNIKESNLKRKGLETFVKTARFLPNVQFVLVGKETPRAKEYLRSIASENVRTLGMLSDEALLRLFQKASVYVQVSAHEGFGCSLAEAMLCGCVPVVTRRGAIPEVVGDTGYYVSFGDPEGTARSIEDALRSKELGMEARKRIREKFPLERRERKILHLVENLIG